MATRVIALFRRHTGYKMVLGTLGALLMAEMIVLLLLNTTMGTVLSKVLVDMVSSALVTLGDAWRWIYKMIGPVVFPLSILTVGTFWSIMRLFRCWHNAAYRNAMWKYLKILEITEGSAPGFGFLGTCIALIVTMQNMDPSLSQIKMLQALLNSSASAFGSTVYGIILAICSFLSKEIFKGFVLKDAPESEKAERSGDREDLSFLNMMRREG